MSYQFSLTTADARLVYLALSYHLARPGSEVDPQTLETTEHGLLEIAQALQPHLNDLMATVALSPYQLRRLGQAMLGVINELKAYPILRAQGGGRNGPVSAVPGFDDMLATLFPEIAEDENGSLDLAQSMMMLRRRLDTAIADATTTEDSNEGDRKVSEIARKRWQFWRRS